MRPRYYNLHGHTPVPCETEGWRLQDDETRRVGETNVGRYRVSTVFLGLDHSFGGDMPMLFETMVFFGPHSLWCARCSTWDQAEAQHQDGVVEAERRMTR